MASVTSPSSTSSADLFASINAANSSKSTKTSSAASDMESQFLTLLVTQLKNQDPLNPMDNNQMTTQLAQISTVSGIEKLNTTMTSLLSAYDNSQAMNTASLIGKNVLTPGGAMQLGSAGAAGGVKLDAAADKVVVTIKDSTGKVVQTQDLGAHAAGSFSFVWDGKDGDGNAQPTGDYKFTVEATKGSEKVTSTTLQLGTVSAVTRSGSKFVLDLSDGSTVNFDDVQQII